jgi:hypothetical protein
MTKIFKIVDSKVIMVGVSGCDSKKLIKNRLKGQVSVIFNVKI